MKYIGNINKKIINGKEYYYHQYRESDKMVSKTLASYDAYDLAFKIYYSSNNDLDDFYNHKFNCDISFGGPLYEMQKEYASYKRRYIYKDLDDYLVNNNVGKVFILYGLRRTGKTTLIFQNIASLTFKEHSKAVFIRISKNNTFKDLKQDLDYLTTHGFKYIYIDEITLLDDFISLSSIFADIYASRCKIILSGTDSLGFYFSKYDELFDRALFAHTTYISFKEFSDVLGIDNIDDYIAYGGTMSLDNKDYNHTLLTDEYRQYIDTAIANNITHSLKNYHYGDHFSHLYPLYENNQLKNVINRIIEDRNHRFAISVIERDFKSNDYGSLKQLLIKNKNERISNALNDVDEDYVIEELMKALDIINKEKQSIKIDADVIKEIEEYLDILDIIKPIDERNIVSNRSYKHMVVIQPAIRYAQAKQLINILLNEPNIIKLPQEIIDIIRDKLDEDIKGRMLEEIVIYQTYLSNNNTFKLLFPVGEFDMVTFSNKSSNVYEIKHSSSIYEKQYQHINDIDKVTLFNQRYYPIKNKIVLYQGDNKTLDNGIIYLNVGEYLKNL